MDIHQKVAAQNMQEREKQSQRIHAQNLENSLFRYCRFGLSGTVFISTEINISCQIVLTDGRVTAASLGDLRGLDALLELNYIQIKQFSFIHDMQFPLTIYANIDCSDAALKEIGFCENELSNRLNQNLTEQTLDTVLRKAG